MLLVFADDWGRHPSSCQHLIKELLPRHAVTWVNTIGTRGPRLNWATLQRGWEKLRSWSPRASGSVEASSNPRIISPRMWPWFTREHDRWLNAQLLNRQLKRFLQTYSEPVYAITTIPLVADLIGTLPVARWTYYCVDDFSVWPGLDRRAMLAMEKNVVSRVDTVVAVSEQLRSQVSDIRSDCHYLAHGVDLRLWQNPNGGLISNLLQSCPRPWIIFWGVIDRRMDVSWVRQLSDELAEGTILLAGPIDDPDPQLLTIPKVRYLAPLPFDQLPHLGQLADVLIMPYADMPVTRAMQPLKLKEYMATGKPVVVRDLPVTVEWSDSIDRVGSAGAFSAAVQGRVRSGALQSQLTARRRLQRESWQEKARIFESWVMGNGDQIQQ